MTGQMTMEGETFRDAFEGSLKRPTKPLQITIRLVLGIFATVLAIWIVLAFVPETGSQRSANGGSGWGHGRCGRNGSSPAGS